MELVGGLALDDLARLVVAEGADRLDQLGDGEEEERPDEGEPRDPGEGRHVGVPAAAHERRERGGDGGDQRVLAGVVERLAVRPEAAEREDDDRADGDERGERGEGSHGPNVDAGGAAWLGDASELRPQAGWGSSPAGLVTDVAALKTHPPTASVSSASARRLR